MTRRNPTRPPDTALRAGDRKTAVSRTQRVASEVSSRKPSSGRCRLPEPGGVRGARCREEEAALSPVTTAALPATLVTPVWQGRVDASTDTVSGSTHTPLCEAARSPPAVL